VLAFFLVRPSRVLEVQFHVELNALGLAKILV